MTDQEKQLLSTARFDVVELPADPAHPTGKQRQVVRHPGAVTIVPMVGDDHVCLIRNFRVSVGMELLELPAGTLESNEPHAVTAQRELIEETGYEAKTLTRFHTFFPLPGMSTEVMHAYTAEGLTYRGQELDAHEDIQVHPMTVDQVRSALLNHEIIDGKTIALLGLFLLEADRLTLSANDL